MQYGKLEIRENALCQLSADLMILHVNIVMQR